MAFFECKSSDQINGKLPNEYRMTISGSGSRGGTIGVGRQPQASVSGVFPWSVLSAFYDTCTITCSASQSPGNPSTSGTGTYYRSNINNDISVRAGTNGINTDQPWSFSATFTAKFYNR